MFHDCVFCLGDTCNEVHGMLLVMDTNRRGGRCLYVYVEVCYRPWSMRQDCDLGLHVVLMSSEIIEVTNRNFLFAVEGMVKLHFTWRNQTGTRSNFTGIRK